MKIEQTPTIYYYDELYTQASCTINYTVGKHTKGQSYATNFRSPSYCLYDHQTIKLVQLLKIERDQSNR